MSLFRLFPLRGIQAAGEKAGWTDYLGDFCLVASFSFLLAFRMASPGSTARKSAGSLEFRYF